MSGVLLFNRVKRFFQIQLAHAATDGVYRHFESHGPSADIFGTEDDDFPEYGNEHHKFQWNNRLKKEENKCS